MHVILSVCQQLRMSSEQNTENLNRMQIEYDTLVGRIEEMTKTMQQDKEIIAEQREQIGAYSSFFFRHIREYTIKILPFNFMNRMF